MAGLFMCLGFPRGLVGLLGLLGFDLGSQSWILLLLLLPLLPSELHLSSIWDSILDSISDPFASV